MAPPEREHAFTLRQVAAQHAGENAEQNEGKRGENRTGQNRRMGQSGTEPREVEQGRAGHSKDVQSTVETITVQ